jgi:hypothetical protein
MKKTINANKVIFATTGVLFGLSVLVILSKFNGSSQLSSTDVDNAATLTNVLAYSESFENGFNGWQTNNGANVSITSDKVHDGTKGLRIKHTGASSYTSAFYRFTTPQTGRLAGWFYDDMSQPQASVTFSATNDAETEVVSVGIRTQTEGGTQYYVYCTVPDKTQCINSKVKRTAGWHSWKVFVTPKGSYGKIDEMTLSNLNAPKGSQILNTRLTSFQRIKVTASGQNLSTVSNTNSSGYFYFDQIFMYTYPAPKDSLAIYDRVLDIYLESYPDIDIANIDKLIWARKGEFCSKDYDWDRATAATTDDVCPDTGDRSKGPLWWFYDQLGHVHSSILNDGRIHEVKYLRQGDPKHLQKAIADINYLLGQVKKIKDSKQGSSIAPVSLGVNAWLIWNKLDVTTQNTIRTMIEEQATTASNATPQIRSKYISDSGGEENVYPANDIFNLALLMQGNPAGLTDKLRQKAKCYAFHGFTKDESYCGFKSRTIYGGLGDTSLNTENFKFDNHGFHSHPAYAVGVATTLSNMSTRSKITFNEDPGEFHHNATDVYKKMQKYIDYSTFRFKGEKIQVVGPDVNHNGLIDDPLVDPINYFQKTGKDDWGRDAMQVFPVFNVNSFTDPDTGITYPDILKHAQEFTYYIRDNYVWQYELPNIKFTEMRMSDNYRGQLDSGNIYPSYRWRENAGQAALSAAYIFTNDPKIAPYGKPNPIYPPK